MPCSPSPTSIGTTQAASSGILVKLLVFFLKAGSLTFGSGLVIVPFLEKGLVQEMGWIDPHQFLVAVAIGMLSPGPVVITATFVGYLVAGFWGSLVSTIGIFLPSFLLILIAAPILRRHRANTNVQGFIKGAYAAAIGTILGACILLGRIAIGDWLTVLIAVAKSRRPVPVQGEQSDAGRRDRGGRTDRLPDPATRVGVRAMNPHDDATHRSPRSSTMKYTIAPLFCRPWTLNGISPRLIESHYENDYGNALDRLNAITEELEALDPATTPGHVIGRLKRDEATRAQFDAAARAVLRQSRRRRTSAAGDDGRGDRPRFRIGEPLAPGIRRAGRRHWRAAPAGCCSPTCRATGG